MIGLNCEPQLEAKIDFEFEFDAYFVSFNNKKWEIGLLVGILISLSLITKMIHQVAIQKLS